MCAYAGECVWVRAGVGGSAWEFGCSGARFHGGLSRFLPHFRCCLCPRWILFSPVELIARPLVARTTASSERSGNGVLSLYTLCQSALSRIALLVFALFRASVVQAPCRLSVAAGLQARSVGDGCGAPGSRSSSSQTSIGATDGRGRASRSTSGSTTRSRRTRAFSHGCPQASPRQPQIFRARAHLLSRPSSSEAMSGVDRSACAHPWLALRLTASSDPFRSALLRLPRVCLRP